MITRITGILVSLHNDYLTLALNGMEYEVLIPEFTRRQLQDMKGKEISLHTIHYYDGNLTQGRITPRLVGFLSEVEREFFELFCSVDGVGAKKALRAMVKPVREVASAIEDQNNKFLSGLPGIGPAMAERIIAKLRRKVPKFALIAARDEINTEFAALDVITETYEALLSLGHSEADAHRLIESVQEKGKKVKDVTEMLQCIYQFSVK